MDTVCVAREDGEAYVGMLVGNVLLRTQTKVSFDGRGETANSTQKFEPAL